MDNRCLSKPADRNTPLQHKNYLMFQASNYFFFYTNLVGKCWLSEKLIERCLGKCKFFLSNKFVTLFVVTLVYGVYDKNYYMYLFFSQIVNCIELVFFFFFNYFYFFTFFLNFFNIFF